ncbi:MAG: hypothetical protein QNK58_00915 [Emcibacteraceae bacterium]
MTNKLKKDRAGYVQFKGFKIRSTLTGINLAQLHPSDVYYLARFNSTSILIVEKCLVSSLLGITSPIRIGNALRTKM